MKGWEMERARGDTTFLPVRAAAVVELKIKLIILV